MPVSGAKPKPKGMARHRVEPVHEWIEVPDVPFDGPVPKLPTRPGGWSARVKRKWRAWSSMPHCRLWGETEWEFAFDSLELAARFFEGDRVASTELRNREKQLGTTGDYRRDLRIRYVRVGAAAEESAGPAEVTRLDDYRDVLDG